MIQFLVIFSLAAAGSLIDSSVALAVRVIARRLQSETLTTGLDGAHPSGALPQADPVVTFGFIVGGYGAVALALVNDLPGPCALERTCLAFALLCVGGLIGEISRTGTTTTLPNLDAHSDSPPQRKPISLPLSAALTLVLNAAFAVLSYGQGLIDIVPMRASAEHVQPASPLLVVAAPRPQHPAPFPVN